MRVFDLCHFENREFWSKLTIGWFIPKCFWKTENQSTQQIISGNERFMGVYYMACTASIQAYTGLRNPSRKKIQSLAQVIFIRKLYIKLSPMHGGHLIPLICHRVFQIDINFLATFHTKHISHMSKITGNSTTKLRSTTTFLYIA